MFPFAKDEMIHCFSGALRAPDSFVFPIVKQGLTFLGAGAKPPKQGWNISPEKTFLEDSLENVLVNLRGNYLVGRDRTFLNPTTHTHTHTSTSTIQTSPDM